MFSMRAFSFALALLTLAEPALASDSFPQEAAPLPITAADPQLGPRDAPLTLVVFSALEPGRTRFLTPLLDSWWAAIEKRYGKKVRLVYAHTVGKTPQARLAAEASLGVWQTHPRGWLRFMRELAVFGGELDINSLAGLAALSGVKSRDRFVADLSSGKWSAALDHGVASRDKVRETPRVLDVFLNGRSIAIDELEPDRSFWHLDRELAEVAAARKRGVAARDVYGFRASQNIKLPRLEPVRFTWPDHKGPSTPRRPIITGSSIGPFTLGMTRDAFDALGLLSEDRPSGWTCVSVESPNKGRCSYSLYFTKGTLQIAEYNPGVANDGFVAKGRHVARDMTLDEAIAALDCGEWSAAEGASSVQCGPSLFIVLGSGSRGKGRLFARMSSADPTDQQDFSPFTLRLDAGWKR